MWEKLTGWLRLLWDSGKQVQEHSAAIRELDNSDRVLIELVRSVLTQQELLRKDNELLRQENEALRQALQQALQHEHELRERDIRELELKLRLQIAEELRRLPPAEDK
ncbi:MAG: hypothetical protein M3347_08520 [Armatimonadota bacterium]|nr:hypothetical protein [Armatimonadota bacterium]